MLESINYDKDQVSGPEGPSSMEEIKSKKASQISFRSKFNKNKDTASAKELPVQTALIMRQKFYDKKSSNKSKDQTSNNTSVESIPSKIHNASILSQESAPGASKGASSGQLPPHQVKMRKNILTQQQRSPSKPKLFNEDLSQVDLNTIQVSSHSLDASKEMS